MLSFLGIVGLLVLGLLLLLYFMQERLIFYPQRLQPSAAEALTRLAPRSEPFELIGADRVKLHGWLLRGEGGGPWPLVIYFAGNAEEVSWLLPELSRVQGWAALLVNYRGYGLSAGHPSEAALYQDALALYDAVTRRPDINGHRVVAMGRSLGTGVATYLASQRNVVGVVLVSGYDSLVEVADAVYPFLPVKLMLKHRFDSIGRAPGIRVPLLALAAEQDTIIPPQRSRNLVQAWGGPAQFDLLDDADHNTIHTHPQYWPPLIVRFLDSL